MKELKFKVFDRKTNKWIGRSIKDRLVKLSFGFITRNEVGLDQSKYTFLQYTGWTDMYGREIYEGDIVRYDRNIHPILDKRTFYVHWFEGRYYLKGDDIIDDIDPSMIEVIGNAFDFE